MRGGGGKLGLRRQTQRQNKKRKMGYRRGEMMLSLVTTILPPYQSGKWPARGAGGLTDYLNREQTSGLDLF